jgi:glutathione S-transferase
LLFPAPVLQRGEVMKWVVWTHVTLGDAVNSWARHTHKLPEDHRNAKAADAAMKDIHANLAVLDQALSGHSYLLGREFSIVDAHLVAFTDYLRRLPIDFSAYTDLNAWSARCAERPAYKKQLAQL